MERTALPKPLSWNKGRDVWKEEREGVKEKGRLRGKGEEGRWKFELPLLNPPYGDESIYFIYKSLVYTRLVIAVVELLQHILNVLEVDALHSFMFYLLTI